MQSTRGSLLILSLSERGCQGLCAYSSLEIASLSVDCKGFGRRPRRSRLGAGRATDSGDSRRNRLWAKNGPGPLTESTALTRQRLVREKRRTALRRRHGCIQPDLDKNRVVRRALDVAGKRFLARVETDVVVACVAGKPA